MNRLLQIFPFFLLLLQLPPAFAQIGDLAQIKEQRRHLNVVSDELMSARVRFLAQADSIDSQVDSLRLIDPESSDLLQARITSHQLVVRLETIDIALDTVRAHSDSLDEDLRDAYDWQISRLLGMLTDAFDEGLYQQLTLFQEERQELGLRVLRSPLRDFSGDDARLSLGDDDGPMELQMKIQLAQDQVSHYQEQHDRIQEWLVRLDRDVVLAADMWQVAQQFDRLRQRNQQMMREFTTPGSGSIPKPVPASDDYDDLETPPPVRVVLLQITQLKARQQELEEIGAVWQERLGVFHRRLQELLDPPLTTP
ncbi:MAG: hypothetical protein HOM68_01715 [Gemmatimonadetes bacterium]|jgi:hypothetical protein|nr:hypothetical protein [Gemmatimonadota bacterium]MBT4611985.1 hypothetical protein [Gemmatimonadota bacterium]MBT5055230.1 hypothetical protein [Gemmatimonadota bacterium]MBT5143113.1 hypothetical protein [Gemmatimonadota bacterium]MBT5588378.1 hypothetical protein [Gemmatimonadota bacterium]